MQVRFLKEWQGSQPGEIGEFVPFLTEDLLSRKIVEPYIDESKKDAEIAELKREMAKLKRQLAKSIDSAPVDKQLKRAGQKK